MDLLEQFLDASVINGLKAMVKHEVQLLLSEASCRFAFPCHTVQPEPTLPAAGSPQCFDMAADDGPDGSGKDTPPPGLDRLSDVTSLKAVALEMHSDSVHGIVEDDFAQSADVNDGTLLHTDSTTVCTIDSAEAVSNGVSDQHEANPLVCGALSC